MITTINDYKEIINESIVDKLKQTGYLGGKEYELYSEIPLSINKLMTLNKAGYIFNGFAKNDINIHYFIKIENYK